MTDTELAFLRAICEQPDEDTPRLAFADWLDELGGELNVAWAELIRVQIELARGARGERAQHLARRDRELEPLVADAWPARTGLQGVFGSWGAWARGFPLILRGDAIDRKADFAPLPQFPLRRIELPNSWDDELISFLRWPALRCVEDLTVEAIHARDFFTSGALALAACPYLTNLKRLRIGPVQMSDEIATAFIESPYLGRVTSAWVGTGVAGYLSPDVERRLSERFGEPTLS